VAISLGIERLGLGAHHSPPSNVEIKIVRDIPPLPLTPSWRDA
jgi:hypothetical protein